MSRFWCVTTFFNPAGYRSRARNYQIFSEHLADQGVDLLTVELAFGDSPFELPESCHVIRVRSDSVMWQKERLINIAIAALPASCDRVAWVDCDLLFPDRDWAARAIDALEGYDIVQLFAQVVHLTPGATRPGAETLGADVGLVRQAGEVPDWLAQRRLGRLPFAVPGYAWAARRALFGSVGLYDRLILGNGDAFLADCLLACHGLHHYWQMRTPEMGADLNRWQERFLANGPPRVGHLAGDVCHLWHGRFADRRYRERDSILTRHAFDPVRDVVSQEGALEWGSAKPALHAEVRDYFLARAEDKPPSESGD